MEFFKINHLNFYRCTYCENFYQSNHIVFINCKLGCDNILCYHCWHKNNISVRYCVKDIIDTKGDIIELDKLEICNNCKYYFLV